MNMGAVFFDKSPMSCILWKKLSSLTSQQLIVSMASICRNSKHYQLTTPAKFHPLH